MQKGSSIPTTTTLIIDIRNFTPNLLDSANTPSGKPRFCSFLESFLNVCFTCISAALRDGYGAEPPVYVNSTGDGLLAVFYSEDHVSEAYLSGILLFRKLKPLCKAYNARRKKSLPPVSFGIGMESGHVHHIETEKKHAKKGLFIETFIGNSINIAARVEQVNKSIDRTNLIISETTNQLLCEKLFNEDYSRLIRKAIDPKLTADQKEKAHRRMHELNNKLLLNFTNYHIFKGIRKSIPIYRISKSLADPENEDFKTLIMMLVSGDAKHHGRIMKLLTD